MYLDSVFDKLGLVGKLATSSKTPYKKTPRSNKIGRCKVYKGLSFLFSIKGALLLKRFKHYTQPLHNEDAHSRSAVQ
jgi:hypothetical protein